FGLGSTWLPFSLMITTLILAAITAAHSILNKSLHWKIPATQAGTSFLFGAGIYCGTFMLGTNFIYRLMFLLLCLPQFLDWSRLKERRMAVAFLSVIILALWSSGSANGHTTFVFWPQILHWWIYSGLITILLINFLRNTNLLSSWNWNSQPADR